MANISLVNQTLTPLFFNLRVESKVWGLLHPFRVLLECVTDYSHMHKLAHCGQLN